MFSICKKAIKLLCNMSLVSEHHQLLVKRHKLRPMYCTQVVEIRVRAETRNPLFKSRGDLD